MAICSWRWCGLSALWGRRHAIANAARTLNTFWIHVLPTSAVRVLLVKPRRHVPLEGRGLQGSAVSRWGHWKCD
jgi:hypothetical protein